MKSIEMRREIARYIGNTAEEISGVAFAQRIHRKEMSIGRTTTLFHDAAAVLLKVTAPLTSKVLEKNSYEDNMAVPALIDTEVNIIALGLLLVDIQAVFITKFGYNTLVQIAPDVARLAKGKIFQRAK